MHLSVWFTTMAIYQNPVGHLSESCVPFIRILWVTSHTGEPYCLMYISIDYYTSSNKFSLFVASHFFSVVFSLWFYGSINIFQILVIIIINFNLIWCVLRETGDFWVSESCCNVSLCMNVLHRTTQSPIKKSSRSTNKMLILFKYVNILHICEWKNKLKEILLYMCMSTKSRFLKLSHHKR